MFLNYEIVFFLLNPKLSKIALRLSLHHPKFIFNQPKTLIERHYEKAEPKTLLYNPHRLSSIPFHLLEYILVLNYTQ